MVCNSPVGGDGDGYVTHPWVGMVYSSVGGGGVTHPLVGMV